MSLTAIPAAANQLTAVDAKNLFQLAADTSYDYQEPAYLPGDGGNATGKPASTTDEARPLFRHLYGGAEMSNAIFAASADGIYVRDTAGRTYIDCASGTFDQPLGHNHPALVKAIQQQAATLSYVGSPLASELSLQLAAKLVSVAPPNLNRVHLRDLTGSTAIEGAVKIAQIATGRRDVITLFGSHHGQTAWTTDLSGNAFRQELTPIHAAGVVRVPAPNCHRCFYKMKFPQCGLYCIDAIRDFIEYASSGSVACVVVEPVLGNGGNIVPPRNYFRKLRQLCDEYGIVLIFDEVQTGIGRLGYFFAAEYFDVNPHILVTAKGLGGPVPRAAILVEERLEKMPRSVHSFTGASSLISTATALETLNIMGAPGFLENVRRIGEVLGQGLRRLAEEFPFVGDVRGIGLMWGMEIVTRDGKPDVVKCNRLIETGQASLLILRSSRYGRGNVIKIRPPLIITDAEVEELLRRLRQALKAAA